ncbi:MAG: hypothetical protein ABIN89_27990 [Chitinophagaceae bacterium]
MKKVVMMKKNILAIVVICISITAYYSCKRDYTMKSPAYPTGGKSFLKIIDASPNFRKVFNQPDSFNVIINGKKITAYTPGSTVLMTFGAIFPTTSSAYGYLAIDPGTSIVSLSLGVSNPDSVQIATFTKTFDPDKYYTFMITDAIGPTRDTAKMFIKDVYSPVPTGYYNLRFIHAVLNDTAGKAVDIWSTRANRYLWTNIKIDSITSFSQWAYNPILSDTFIVRRTGTPAIVLDTLSAVNFSNQRTYTLYYRGDGTISATTNLKKRRLAAYLHQ